MEQRRTIGFDHDTKTAFETFNFIILNVAYKRRSDFGTLVGDEKLGRARFSDALFARKLPLDFGAKLIHFARAIEFFFAFERHVIAIAIG